MPRLNSSPAIKNPSNARPVKATNAVKISTRMGRPWPIWLISLRYIEIFSQWWMVRIPMIRPFGVLIKVLRASIELGVFIAYLDCMVSAVAAHQESASGCISKEIELLTWQVPSRSPARSRADQIGVGSFSRCRYPRLRHSLKSRFRLYPWPNRSFRYRCPPGRRTPKLRCRYHLRLSQK